MAHTVIGTAGHIDHGKTLLVKALTGMDTDRAPEEKARGITIELGFAFLGERATIIDVPGHERFVKTMVAGVSTIDLALLVIAADDGVMPQSREHLDILHLLGVRRGLVALNKIDLVEEEWLDLVEEEVRALVQGSFMEGCEIFRVSAQTGAGVEVLGRRLHALADQTAARRVEGPFRLPVDRAFQVKGFGLVCTGTVLGGRLRAGEVVELHPAGRQLRVRSLQQHGRAVEEVRAGDRAALNLPGVDAQQIARGDVLAEPGYFRPTYMLDARLRLLASAPRALDPRTRVRLHLGTREVLARVVLLEGEALEAGRSALVQLHLEMPVVAAWGDPFVIRRYSPALTIGGGRVLDPFPLRHRRQARVLEQLSALEGETAEEVVEAHLRHAPTGVKALRRLAGELGLGAGHLEALLAALEREGRVMLLQVNNQACAIHGEVWKELAARIEAALHAFHQANPLKKGLKREELRARSARWAPRALFEAALQGLERAGQVGVEGALVHAAAHRIHFTPAQEALRRRIEAALEQAELSRMPDPATLARSLEAEPAQVETLLRALQTLGVVVFLDDALFLHAHTLAKLQEQLRRYLEEKGEITVAAFRDLIRGNRKYAMALLTYLDAAGFTERRGDVRVLRFP